MKMTAEIRIPAPADEAWQLVGTRFGDIASWAAPIVASSLDRDAAAAGAVRTCHVQGFGPMGDMVVRERLVAFDDARRSLTYDAVDGMPSFVRRATNRWTVTADGAQGCVVRSDVTMRLAWWLRPMAPLVAGRLRTEARGVLEELGHVLGTGRPHPRKVASSGVGSPTVER
ncbi:MAG: SRPBCC family protein [Actinobacteria bacterium]|nr:SRPBCC family protein [Actinomycetota bacterium]